jgi:septal ring factor EnvC (AmiA/AmiB activator)
MLPLLFALCAASLLFAAYFFFCTKDLERDLALEEAHVASLRCSIDSFAKDVAEKTRQISELEKAYADLDQKHKLNPTYETQRLLTDLMGDGQTLFYIERLPPENVLLRR